MNRPDVVANAVEAGLCAALDQTGSGLLTKFICVAEVVGEDGEQKLWTLGTDNLPTWEAMGMLQYVLASKANRVQ